MFYNICLYMTQDCPLVGGCPGLGGKYQKHVARFSDASTTLGSLTGCHL
jgi:hypothetical protein